ncbi:MAG TPA: HAD family hydrolase [Candidatus Atribacteria bacterium]|nr:HAD family hydrolase [Candidatus Atribacteria bacterium]
MKGFITKSLIEKIFQPASLQRWNDQIRPIEFTELDKQAHKMIIAWTLGKIAEDEENQSIDWRKMIEYGIFQYFQRTILTDLKPQIYHSLMAQDGARKKLNDFVQREMEESLSHFSEDFYRKFIEFISSTPEDEELHSIEFKLINAAHFLATQWEFNIIAHFSPPLFGINSTREEIQSQIAKHLELKSVKKFLYMDNNLSNFIDLCGQLRFQRRWAHIERIPKTSVLGHLLVVAMLSYFLSLFLNPEPCAKRIYNNWYGALFHDLPEVLTRDIISPVKRALEELETLIKEEESDQISKKLKPLLKADWYDEILYFIMNEFETKIIDENKKIHYLENEIVPNQFNLDRYSPIDGKLIKICDKIAAFLEAYFSIVNGVASPQLIEAKGKLFNELKDRKLDGIDIFLIIDLFR